MLKPTMRGWRPRRNLKTTILPVGMLADTDTTTGMLADTGMLAPILGHKIQDMETTVQPMGMLGNTDTVMGMLPPILRGRRATQDMETTVLVVGPVVAL